MAQVIIYEGPEGNVHVCVPTPEVLESHGIDWIKEKDTPEDSIIVDASELPEADNDFFNAWRLVDGAISIDLTAAKEITKARLRIEREPLLAAQDVLFQRALESGADTTVIVAEKQRLRDLPTLADDCTTLDELKELKP